MDQLEFSAMLTKMTGEPPAAADDARHLSQPITESYELEVLPELAFDFSLPFDNGDMSFDTSYLGFEG